MKSLSKIIAVAIFVIPLLLFSNNQDVNAARFGYDYVNQQGIFSYNDVSEYLVRVQGNIEITHVDLEGNKNTRTIEPTRDGIIRFNENGTYTIRLLLPNGRTLGYSFYQTIYTRIPLR